MTKIMNVMAMVEVTPLKAIETTINMTSVMTITLLLALTIMKIAMILLVSDV